MASSSLNKPLSRRPQPPATPAPSCRSDPRGYVDELPGPPVARAPLLRPSNLTAGKAMPLELHPVLKTLQMLVGTNGNVSSKLEEVMQYAKFGWAATYVITDTGQMVFKTSRSKKVARMEAFGGSMNKPTNIVFALAKLRRELADESSITISNVSCVRMSPLIVLRDGLVQIAMIKQAWMDTQTLWVPEAWDNY